MATSPARKLWTALIGLLVVALIFMGIGFGIRVSLTPLTPGSTAKEIIEVNRGITPLALSQTLEGKGLIRNAQLFYWYGKIRGSWTKLKAGEYEISASMTPTKILDVITSGISLSRPFLVREGMNVYEIAQEIQTKGYGEAAKFLVLVRNPQFIATLNLSDPQPKSLEGFLYPDTYMLQRKMTQEEIVRAMVKRFQSAWGPNEENRAREIGMNRNEVITLASVVEKETGAPEERPIIAGVFTNRLKKRMKLQSDPTSIYGIWTRYDGNIRKRDLQDPNPYNTYYVPALPIGPIGNPGSEAIQAVLYPAEHHYLYFVSKNDGRHVFTSTYEDHSKAVADYQLNAKAREGKSWRDLNQKESSNDSPSKATPKNPVKNPKAAMKPSAKPANKQSAQR